jgi:DNA gyrase subunit B
MINNGVYDASKIKVLKNLEAVRQNIGMYIGDSGIKGLHHLINEIIDNSVDEAMAGFCDQISIVLHEDKTTISVEDNGRGIPVDIHPDENKSALELVLTELHAGGKFGSGSGYIASGGMHGVGASCVNALSIDLKANVWRDGFLYEQNYSKGIPLSDVKKVKTLDKKDKQHGTKITWTPDSSIFSKIEYDDKIILKRIREISYLNKSLKISYLNKLNNIYQEFKHDGGIVDYLNYILEANLERYPVQPIYGEYKNNMTSKSGEMQVQIALSYTDEDDENILSFCNNINTADGGTHVSGFKTALTRVVNNYGKNSKLLKEGTNLSGEDIREGLRAIISVRIPRPEFVSQTKQKLGTVEAESIVSNATHNILNSYFDKNPAVIKKIIERALLVQQARQAAKKSSDLVKRKGFLSKSNRMPGKLYDCNTDKKHISELFIVEGDSAAGSAKDGRDSEFQAILPIRGKIINAEKKDISLLLKNKEIQNLIIAIGTGIKDEFDISRLRYNKIIIMTDADDDGAHISTLLMTFFYRYMRPLITNGHLYLAQPPLYCVDSGTKNYCWSDDELKNFTKTNKTKIVRFKGLGEMDAEQLFDTTMDINTRRLIKIEEEDQIDCEKIISVLMGDNVQFRKDHLTNKVNYR